MTKQTQAVAVLEPSGVQPMMPVSRDASSLMEVISRAASDPSMDIGKLERLMDLYERIKKREAEVAFSESMRDAQAKMPRMTKESTNPSTNSKYIKLERLNDAAVPIYTDCGFSLQFSQSDCPTPGKIRVMCKVAHKVGHSETHHLDLSPDDIGMKGSPTKTKIHGEGSAFSYGRRYLTLMIFNIITGDDDDANLGNKPKPHGPMRATDKTRLWFLEQTKPLHVKMQAYAIDMGWIMPNEGIDQWALDHVPVTRQELDIFQKMIEALP